MEDSNDLLILCSPGNGHSCSSVKVIYDNEYNMKTHALHKNIEEVWQTKLKECSNLFNALKFRLHRTELMMTQNLPLPTVKLLIGITCYKDFIGTNCAPYAVNLNLDGVKDYQHSQVYMADPIGVGGLVVTADNDVVFIRRSKTCAEMQLMIDRPGGHPEPDVVTSETRQTMDRIEVSKITEEIFGSVLKEIRDEINIPLKHLSPPVLLGIGYNPNTWRRPSLEFLVRCTVKTSEVQELYQQQTQAESEESIELIVIPLEVLLKNDIKQMKLYNEFTHPAKSALYFLKVFMSK